jgi:hypothetical protein
VQWEFTLDHSIPGAAYSQLYLLDMDGLAGLDIVTNSTVFLNTLSGVSVPPPVPTGLNCRMEGNNLRLFWNETSQAHQYRFEIYEDGERLVTCGSAASGKLLRINRTPTIHDAPVFVGPWPSGKYSFRVQAIDASHRASAFSVLQEMDEVPVGLETPRLFQVFPNPASEEIHVSV